MPLLKNSLRLITKASVQQSKSRDADELKLKAYVLSQKGDNYGLLYNLQKMLSVRLILGWNKSGLCYLGGKFNKCITCLSYFEQTKILPKQKSSN